MNGLHAPAAGKIKSVIHDWRNTVRVLKTPRVAPKTAQSSLAQGVERERQAKRLQILTDRLIVTGKQWQVNVSALRRLRHLTWRVLDKNVIPIGRPTPSDWADALTCVDDLEHTIDTKQPRVALRRHAKADESAVELTREARVVALLVMHPGWTDTRLAREAGVSRTSLYRIDKFKQAKAAMKQQGRDNLRRRQNTQQGKKDDE